MELLVNFSPTFRRLSERRRQELIASLVPQVYEDGDVIVTQGDTADKSFYVIQSGVVRCTTASANRPGGGVAIEEELCTLTNPQYFGEMALLLNEPRHANCVASGRVKVYKLAEAKFFELLRPLEPLFNNEMRSRILRSIPLLKRMNDEELAAVSAQLHVRSYQAGESVYCHGDEATHFFIVHEGELRVLDEQGHEASQLFARDFVGSDELLAGDDDPARQRRRGGVVAAVKSECLVIAKAPFRALLGGLVPQMGAEYRLRDAVGARRTHLVRTLSRGHYELGDLRVVKTIGRGTFGKVRMVEHGPSRRVMALKVMCKKQIAASRQVEHTFNERDILSEISHPFILELAGTYQTNDQLYMLLELVQGGELWSYMYEKRHHARTRHGGFTEATAMFYFGCVVSAFDYIHGLGIVYRDLKPENLLLDAEGYLKVVDFGFAKHIPFEGKDEAGNAVYRTTSKTLCGTPEYLAPEMIARKPHDRGVDIWALGCFLHELLLARTPFADDAGGNVAVFKKVVMHRAMQLRGLPSGFNTDARDLIEKLLMPVPTARLGYSAVAEIKQHAWFAELDFRQLERKELPAPFVPRIASPLDSSNFDEAFNSGDEEAVEHFTGRQSVFDGF